MTIFRECMSGADIYYHRHALRYRLRITTVAIHLPIRYNALKLPPVHIRIYVNVYTSISALMLICRGNPPPENNDQNNTMAIRNGVVATNNLMMQLRFVGLTRGNARQKQKFTCDTVIFCSLRALAQDGLHD